MIDGYHESRFAYDKNRSVLWQTLCDAYFNKLIPESASVLELGAGYCDFINNISADKKFAIDLWPGIEKYAQEPVQTKVGDIADIDSFVEPASLDFIFASNIFEHISQDHLSQCLKIIHEKLKAGGTLNILQPNYKYAYREYFDDYTHVAIYSDVSMSDFLEANQFEVFETHPRFLPLSIKSRLPVSPFLIKTYLKLPFSPLGKQMFIRAKKVD